jgi:hypothetical protein
MLDELDPRSMIEQYLADQIILCRWKILQCDAAEAAVMRAAVYRDQHPVFTVNDTINPTLGKLKYTLVEMNTPLNRSCRNDYVIKVGYNAPELDKIHRYRKDHERALDRALKEWDNLNRAATPIGTPRNYEWADATPRPRRTARRAHSPKADLTKRNPAEIDATPDEQTTCAKSDPRATRHELAQTRTEDRQNPCATTAQPAPSPHSDAALPLDSAPPPPAAALPAPRSRTPTPATRPPTSTT